jgi:hypothetical protein
MQHYNQTQIFLVPNAILMSIFLILGVIGLFMGLALNVLPTIIRKANIENLEILKN